MNAFRSGNAEALAINQLKQLLQRYPSDSVDIEGVILDYMGRTGAGLAEVFGLSPLLYYNLFASNDTRSGERLIAALLPTEDAGTLSEGLRSKYALAADMLERVRNARAVQRSNEVAALFSDPAVFFGGRRVATVWQLSDIHFGVFNRLENDPEQLAYQIARIIHDYPKLNPDAIIVSGDVTSVASRAEFRLFNRFSRKLQDLLWGRLRPGRMLVIPGNHDVAWRADGKADRMRGFADFVSKDGHCVTPFGKEHEEFEGGDVIVDRFNQGGPKVPPFALVSIPSIQLEIQLVITGFFSGEIPEHYLGIARQLKGSDEELVRLLRVDSGAVDKAYLYYLDSVRNCESALRVAVVHHNPIQYGMELVSNPQAPELMRTLFSKGASLALHGHVHMVENFGVGSRPVRTNESYPIPCPTLCSYPSAGGRGLAIHFIGCDEPARVVESVIWEIGGNGKFESANARLRYRCQVEGGRLHTRI